MIEVGTTDEAVDLFFETFEERAQRSLLDELEELDGLTVGNWATLDIKLPSYHSQMPSPFIEAYDEIQTAIYRLAAFVEYGNADSRNLTFDDLDRYQLVVKVSEGSSVFTDNLPELINKIAEAAFGKMSGKQAALTILGLALLLSSVWGGTAYLEGRKEVRIQEIHAEERKEALQALSFATSEHRRQMDRVLNIMEESGGAARRAAHAAIDVQNEVLRAAAKVDETEISGYHISRSEARELRGSARRQSSTSIVEKEMRVVDVNTADPAQTTVILEDLDTLNQHRVTFSDALLDAQNRAVVFQALEERGVAWFKILEKRVAGEITSLTIISVGSSPDLIEGQEQEEKSIRKG